MAWAVALACCYVPQNDHAVAKPDISDYEQCIAEAIAAETRIAACTRAIADGQREGRTLAELHSRRGDGWFVQAEFDRAFDDYEAAIQRDAGYAPAYVGRGIVWRARKDPDRALAEFAHALELDPGNVRARYNRALTWSDKGESRKAAADYDEVIRLDPNNAATYHARGWVWFELRDHERAISDFTSAISGA